MNDTIFVAYGILRLGVASSAESELGALFLNRKEGDIRNGTHKTNPRPW